MDNDGVDDVIYTFQDDDVNNQGGVAWLKNNDASGTTYDFTGEAVVGRREVIRAPFLDAHLGLPADLNGDSVLDVVISGDNYPLLQLVQRPPYDGTSFSIGVVGDARPESRNVCVDDFDGDHHVDIVATFKENSDAPTDIDRAGRLTFSSGPLFAETTVLDIDDVTFENFFGLACGDYDFDGDVDLFYTHEKTGGDVVFLENRLETGHLFANASLSIVDDCDGDDDITLFDLDGDNFLDPIFICADAPHTVASVSGARIYNIATN